MYCHIVMERNLFTKTNNEGIVKVIMTCLFVHFIFCTSARAHTHTHYKCINMCEYINGIDITKSSIIYRSVTTLQFNKSYCKRNSSSRVVLHPSNFQIRQRSVQYVMNAISLKPILVMH